MRRARPPSSSARRVRFGGHPHAAAPHLDVDQGNVRGRPSDELDRLVGVARRAHDLHVVLGSYEIADRFEEGRFVVHHDDTDRFSTSHPCRQAHGDPQRVHSASPECLTVRSAIHAGFGSCPFPRADRGLVCLGVRPEPDICDPRPLRPVPERCSPWQGSHLPSSPASLARRGARLDRGRRYIIA